MQHWRGVLGLWCPRLFSLGMIVLLIWDLFCPFLPRLDYLGLFCHEQVEDVHLT
jgi:hypothetical protein